MLNLPPQLLIVLIFCLMLALTLHEFAHAYVAYLCGDSTAKLQGRLTINPFAHLDLVGSLMLVMIGFGYAKPVPINPANFRRKNADVYVAAAGPGMNFLLAILAGVLWNGLAGFDLLETPWFPLPQLLFWFILVNLNLCLFNLIPLGPLDGSYVLPHFLPYDLKRRYQFWNLQYGTYVILGLMLFSYALPHLSPFRWISHVSQQILHFMIT